MQADAAGMIEVTSLCDIDAGTLRALADEFSIRSRYTDLDDMLASNDAEAVLIIVPSSLHYEHALKCLNAGRHVYVQKPLAGSVAEATDLIDAASRRMLRLTAAPNQALWPLYSRIRDEIQSGTIGEPYFAQGSTMGWDGYHIHHETDPGWHFAEGAGPLRDHGVYGIQALTTMLGRVAEVSAFTNVRVPQRNWRGQTVPVTESDNTALLMRFQSGALGVLPEAWAFGSEATAAFRISGLEGSIIGTNDFASYRGIFPLSCALHTTSGSQVINVRPEEVSFLAGRHLDLPNPHVWADIHHFALSIRGDGDLNASAVQARHTVDIIETAFKAAELGRTLTVETSPSP